METTLRKWGNSPALRLPVALLREADMAPEQKVSVTVADGRIVIAPCERVAYDLDTLLDGITPRNRHAALDTGAPVGKEAW